MSKLNVYHHELRHNEYAEFYLKYEADKVIADLLEKNKCLARKDLIRANVFKEIRRYKYKRCMAMAEMCNAMYDKEDAKVNGRGASWDYTSPEMKYWERWSNRWLILSDKFKEAK